MQDELKAILKSPKRWVTIIGVSLVPMLYNVIFLSSMWNPYGNLDKLPVAVVNQDKPATLNEKTLTVGQNMIDSLAENKELDYHFVTKEDAEQGLREGKYYMVITFPKDMSEHAATLMTDTPKQVVIHYQTTKGRSFVAAKMSDTAMNKLQAAVSETITKTYTNEVFKSMGELTTGMREAVDGTQKLDNGTNQLQEGSQLLTTNLQTLVNSSQRLATGTETLANGVMTYTNGVETLANGMTSLSSGLVAYTSGVDTLTQGVDTLNSHTQTLVGGVAKLANNQEHMQQLVDGANQLSSGLVQLASKSTLSAEQQANIDKLLVGLPQLNQAIQTLNEGLQKSALSTGDIAATATQLTHLKNQLQNLSNTSQSKALVAIQATAAYQTLTESEKEEMVAAVSQTSASQFDVSAIVRTVDGLTAQLSQLTTLKGQVSNLAEQSHVALTGATTALIQLKGGLIEINAVTSQHLAPGSQQVAQGITRVQQELSMGANQLLTGISTFSRAVTQLDNGANQLARQNALLLSGLHQLETGANQLTSHSATLTTGAKQLFSGTTQLASGSDQLAQGGERLSNGLVDVSNGTSTLLSSLTAAKERLSFVSVEKENADAVAKPVALTATDTDNVETNGVGLAPYMMSVSLMVVALSANVIFAKSLSGKEPKNRLEWARNKLLINGIIATAAPLILVLAIQIIGIHPSHLGKTMLLTLLASWSMMSIVTALVGWDDRYGSFLSLILLLLQLGSSAGTYPIELSHAFFKTVQPYLPMSYAVSGLRETISLGGNITTQVGILVGFMVGGMVLALAIYRQPIQATHQSTPLNSSII